MSRCLEPRKEGVAAREEEDEGEGEGERVGGSERELDVCVPSASVAARGKRWGAV